MDQKGLFVMSTKELERLTAIQRVVDKKITQAIASEHLGLTVRQIKRLVRQYKQDGALGLVSRHRGQPSNRKYTDAKYRLLNG